jgi:hypothetical protein
MNFASDVPVLDLIHSSIGLARSHGIRPRHLFLGPREMRAMMPYFRAAQKKLQTPSGAFPALRFGPLDVLPMRADGAAVR